MNRAIKIYNKDIGHNTKCDHLLWKVWHDEMLIPNTYVHGVTTLVELGNDTCIEYLVEDVMLVGGVRIK